mmetsp:Transcript_10457/g.39522  ORF Transcript_10457/g.39522 Transcript_10457/m.39522 type:complete len:112 (+) Transcript_10457:1798-2133(+)
MKIKTKTKTKMLKALQKMLKTPKKMLKTLRKMVKTLREAVWTLRKLEEEGQWETYFSPTTNLTVALAEVPTEFSLKAMATDRLVISRLALPIRASHTLVRVPLPAKCLAHN